jgi:hypothetical protein
LGCWDCGKKKGFEESLLEDVGSMEGLGEKRRRRKVTRFTSGVTMPSSPLEYFGVENVMDC